jgi:RNA polymerase sigma-70 factor (ECF subfamily)
MSKSIDRDTFLTRKLKGNDPKAVSILYQQYFKDVAGIAYDIVKDTEVAKDIAQELFISIWIKRHELDFKKSMKRYLMQSARNHSIISAKIPKTAHCAWTISPTRGIPS